MSYIKLAWVYEKSEKKNEPKPGKVNVILIQTLRVYKLAWVLQKKLEFLKIFKIAGVRGNPTKNIKMSAKLILIHLNLWNFSVFSFLRINLTIIFANYFI